jgi:hypothetical protein
MLATLLAAALLLGQTQVEPVRTNVTVPVFPTGPAQTVNIVNWDSNKLPPIFVKSDQLPLTDDEIIELSKGGFSAEDLVKMVGERRCLSDGSAAGMIKLKKAGVPMPVIAAMSTYGIKPNRELNLQLTFDFSGDSTEARQGYLYVFVDDGDIARVFTANINDLLKRRWPTEQMVDKSDLMITRTVRRIPLAGIIPLKSYGKHTVYVASSANPTITHPSQLSELDRRNAQVYSFDYPRTSLSNVCRLFAGYRRDPVLTYQWRYMGSRFECEWN